MTYNRKNISMKILIYILAILLFTTSCVSPTWGPITNSDDLAIHTEELNYLGGSTTIIYKTPEQKKQLVQFVEKEFGKTYKVTTSYRPASPEFLVVENLSSESGTQF